MNDDVDFRLVTTGITIIYTRQILNRAVTVRSINPSSIFKLSKRTSYVPAQELMQARQFMSIHLDISIATTEPKADTSCEINMRKEERNTGEKTGEIGSERKRLN